MLEFDVLTVLEKPVHWRAPKWELQGKTLYVIQIFRVVHEVFEKA